jgi:hypothetical protein
VRNEQQSNEGTKMNRQESKPVPVRIAEGAVRNGQQTRRKK